ncbi:MAG: hypothetical protein GF353_04790 [Candidatus Lokiarchaeota archaeon]|nr:hypothetical protein [Candidatus Lokiarchaeota archaeon]
MKDQFLIGLDIGGANTKGAIIHFKSNQIKKSFSYIEYFPFWQKTTDDIEEMFIRVIEKLLKSIKNDFSLEEINKVCVTITAELSDAFQTKHEGIHLIIDALLRLIEEKKLLFVANNGVFLDWKKAKQFYLSIAASNWMATAMFLSNFVSQCILIDAGSTTIDVIPIFNGNPVSKGKDDISRLLNHELIYTGGLRATIPSITHKVPYNHKKIRISFEKFALVSDVHRILNNISEEQYINETADGRSTSLLDCYSRLARIICMDIETIDKKDLKIIAEFIYDKQLKIISEEFNLFLNDLIKRYPEFEPDPLFLVTGLGRDYLAKKALERLGYTNIQYYEDLTPIADNVSSSALAVAAAYYFKTTRNNKSEEYYG